MANPEQNRREYHPAVSILSWLLFALAVEFASPARLSWLALPAFLLLVQREAVRRFVRLIWKARWLWLALMLLYAWTLPGTLLWPSDYSPSLEGLQAGLVRVSRLLLMLAALARLLSELTAQQLAGGIYLLAKPLAWLGLDRRALAVRLALTLECVERAPQKRSWLDELSSPVALPAGPEEIRLLLPAVGTGDVFVLLASLSALAAVLP